MFPLLVYLANCVFITTKKERNNHIEFSMLSNTKSYYISFP